MMHVRHRCKICLEDVLQAHVEDGAIGEDSPSASTREGTEDLVNTDGVGIRVPHPVTVADVFEGASACFRVSYHTSNHVDKSYSLVLFKPVEARQVCVDAGPQEPVFCGPDGLRFVDRCCLARAMAIAE